MPFWRASAAAYWSGLAQRERRMVVLAAAVVVAALAWWLAVAPALRVAREAPARLLRLDDQLQRMAALAAEAAELRARPRVGTDQALRMLEQSVRDQLGPQAQLTVLGDRATVVCKDVAPQVLAAWLAQVREDARAVPVDARLTRGPAGWNGTLVLQLSVR